MIRKSFIWLLSILVLTVSIISQPRVLYAQETASAPTFKTEELDQMLAPIALYPDEVLSNVLMASTYPLEIVQAARWRKEPVNAKLKGDALSKALEEKDWDPSVKALTQFPDVLDMMSDKLEWTQKLGDAFLAQQEDVFGRIQFLRQKADEAGNLKTTKQQKVTKQERTSPPPGGEASSSTQSVYYVIEPADPEVVYVPVYEPAVVYGSWWYPSYPPYYWNWYPGSTLVSGFFWGTGFAVANSLWGWNHCDWNRGNIDIDVNRYNNINVNRAKITSNTWNHNPAHRGAVPYRDKVSREKFSKNDKLKDARQDFRGFDKSAVQDKLGADSAAKIKDKLGEGGGQKIKDKVGDGGAANIKDKLGEGGGQKIKDKAAAGGLDKAKDRIGDGGGQKVKDKAGNIKSKNAVNKAASRDIKKPAAKPAAKALDVKPKAQVKQHVDRGNVSRKSAASHPSAGRAKAGPRPGGGGGRAKRGGGGGGRRR